MPAITYKKFYRTHQIQTNILSTTSNIKKYDNYLKFTKNTHEIDHKVKMDAHIPTMLAKFS